MAQKNTAIPSWMSEVKDYATKTNEWTDLTKSIYEAVDQHLSQNHVSYFTDLTEAEKSLLLERAARSLSNTDDARTYENLQSKLSYLLDQSVSNQVAKKLVEENPLDTKTDLILDTTSEGIVSLLRKHPEQKYKLRVFLNQSMPPQIRFLAFQLFYPNHQYKKTFVAKLALNPKHCLSNQDLDIQKRCESLMNSAITFRDMRDSRGNLNSMKGILSYYHTTLNSNRELSETEYYLAPPIVYTHCPPLPKYESPTEKSMVALVEIYLQFVDTLPSACKATFQDDQAINSEMDMLIQNTFTHLEKFDPQLNKRMKELANKTGARGMEDIGYQTGYRPILASMMKRLYSGYLNLDALMFVWDQYTIGSDVPGYSNELLPVISSIILMILRDQLMTTSSLKEFDDCLRNIACFIQTRQIQTLLNKYFFKALQAKLNTLNKFGPVIDPTVGRLQPWEHWHQDIIPRRAVRGRGDVIVDDGRLRQELNQKIQSEKDSQDEIDRLRRELERLKNRQGETTAAVAPPDPISQTPEMDLMRRVRASIDHITNGEGSRRKELDEKTADALRNHKLDLKIAEKEVFGHYLAPNEWDSLNEKEKKDKGAKMLAIVNSRLDRRLIKEKKK